MGAIPRLLREDLTDALNFFKGANIHVDLSSIVDIPGVPKLFDPVVHELAHLVTTPRSKLLNSDQLTAVLDDYPVSVGNRLEIASWLIERRAVISQGGRLKHKAALEIGFDSCQPEVDRENLTRLAYSWSRQPWVHEATEKVIWALRYRRDPGVVKLPDSVWEGA